MKQITKCHGFQVHVVVGNVEISEIGWCLCICVCVCVMSLAALQVRFPVCSGGLVVSLYDTHEAEPLGRNWHALLTAGRNSYVPSLSPLPNLIERVTFCRFFDLLRCYAKLVGGRSLMFLDRQSAPSFRANLALEGGDHSLYRNVANYQATLRNIPKERRLDLRLGEGLFNHISADYCLCDSALRRVNWRWRQQFRPKRR